MDKRSIFGLEPDQLDEILSAVTDGLDESERDKTESSSSDQGKQSEKSPLAETTASMQGSMDQTGSRIGRYKLLNVLGEGGMGVVYLAEQKRPIRRRVALKVIKPGMDSKSVVARFEAERQALALLDHPNIAHVHDAGTTGNGRPYFVMEHVKGLSITEHCDRHKLTVEDRLILFRQVCLAVHHAHQKGIIHRDIKPSNILVSLQGDQAVPKIIDFGVAKALAQPLTERTLVTEQGQLFGTPEYMSPEQADMANEDIDTRSDIYSLGVLLYVLLTGVLPFDSDTLREGGIEHIRKIIRETDPKTPSTRLSSLGEEAKRVAEDRRTEVATLSRCLRRELGWIPLKAMRKDRAERYRSVSEMSDDIQNYLSGSPLIAGPETKMYRLSKVIRRHKVPVSAGLAIVFTLIIGLAVSIHLYRKAQNALNAYHQLESKVEVDDLLTTVQRLHNEGRYSEALKELEPYLSQGNLGPTAYLRKARILIDTGQYAQARSILDNLANKTESPEIASSANLLLARIVLQDDPDRAKEHRQIAESIMPKTAEAYTFRAMTAETPEQVIHWLSEAIKLDSSYYPARKARALAYYGLGEAQNMIGDVEAMIALRKEDSLGYHLRAIIRREAGQFDQAIQDHDRAISLCFTESERLELYSQRRETFMRAGNYEAALADARQCTVLEPNEPLYAFHIFTALFEKGDYDTAKALYDQKARLRFEGKLEWYRWYWRCKAWCEMYVFDTLSTGRILTLPEDLRYKEPFTSMFEAVKCYRWLEAHQATKLLTTSSVIFQPRPNWSPDGQKIMDVRFGNVSKLQIVEAEVPSIQGTYGIEIMDVKTRKKQMLSRIGNEGHWSPDGQHILFKHFSKRGQFGVSKPEFWLISPEGGEPRKLTDALRASWSADSKHIYYQDEREGNLYYMSIDEHRPNSQLILEYPVKYQYRDLDYRLSQVRISPNEEYMAYDNVQEIHIVDRASGESIFEFPIQVPSESTKLHWEGKSQYLFVRLTPHIGPSSFWVLDIEKRQAHHIFDHPVWRIALSPQQDKALLTINKELWLIDVDPSIPIYESLGPAQNWDQYLGERLKWLEGCIKAEPSIAVNYLLRAIVYIYQSEYEKAVVDLEHCTDLASQFSDPMIDWFRWFTYYFTYTDRYEEGKLFAWETISMYEKFPKSATHIRNRWDPFLNLIRIYASQNDSTSIHRVLAKEGTILARLFAEQHQSSIPNLLYKPGTSQYNMIDNSHTVIGAGGDIGDVCDQFHFAFKRLEGDGSITVRLDSIQDVHRWAKAGIMIRDSLELSEKHASLFISPRNRVAFVYRPEPWSESAAVVTEPNTITLPHWIRLTRQGNRFTGEHSHDGITWATVDAGEIVRDIKGPDATAMTEIDMQNEVYIGLAVCSHRSPFITAEAKIANVTVTGSVNPTGPFTESQDIGFPTSKISHTR